MRDNIEIKLPDGSYLIAEGNQDSNFPGISIFIKDADGETDAVAFAEYNPDKDIGHRLMVGAYRNDKDDTMYYESFNALFKPSFNDMYQIYKESKDNKYTVRRNDGFMEIIRTDDSLLIYRDFIYDNDAIQNHIGHNLIITAYCKDGYIQNISIECTDCNEVIYSVENGDDI